MLALLNHLGGSPPARQVVNHTFRTYARRRVRSLDQTAASEVQRRTLRRLLDQSSATRFGRDHRFATLTTVETYQDAVPLRTYEDLWNLYLKDAYPVFEDLTWPGRIPYLALTSGTTQGATKYIPISREMLRSNRKAAQTVLAYHYAFRPEARIFHGQLFVMGGSTDLEEPVPGVRQGDLSAIANLEAPRWAQPYAFPPLELALEADWDRKLETLANLSTHQPITMVTGVPSWMLMLFQKLLEQTGRSSLSEIWPKLEVVVHGGVKFDPYESVFREIIGDPRVRLQETYPCSEGFIGFGDPETGLLRLLFDHGLFYEFVPVEDLDSARPTRHWLGTVEPGVDYAIVVTTCAGLWSHIVGDTVRFESLNPPLFRFTGRTKYTLSAFGEHLINEEVEAAMAEAAEATGASVIDWHVGPVFVGLSGYHHYVVEFLDRPENLEAFRDALDGSLRRRNADYDAHRTKGVGMPAPALMVSAPGGFVAWMRARNKLGGQNKVPRMDNSGQLTDDLIETLERLGLRDQCVPPDRVLKGSPSARTSKTPSN